MNHVMLIGRLVRDPNKATTQSGHSVCNCTLAVERPFAKDDVVDFIDVIFWRKQADIAEKYLKKGDRVAVHGQIQVNSYTDKEGNNRKAWAVHCNEMKFLENKNKNKNNETEEEHEDEIPGTEVSSDNELPF